MIVFLNDRFGIKAHIYVAIAVLNIDNLVTDDIYARSVAEELLVCRFCIILLCLKELMVENNIIGFHLIQFTGRHQGFYKQGVEFVCIIEIVGLALIRSIGDVILCQFPDGSEDGVRTACTKHWMT